MNLLKCAITGLGADASHSLGVNIANFYGRVTLCFSNVKKLQKLSVKKPHV